MVVALDGRSLVLGEELLGTLETHANQFRLKRMGHPTAESPLECAPRDAHLLGDVDVDADDLHALLSGRDPRSGARLGQPHTVPGFDLTFRAPKSVSVLFGLGEPGVAALLADLGVCELFERRYGGRVGVAAGAAQLERSVRASTMRTSTTTPLGTRITGR